MKLIILIIILAIVISCSRSRQVYTYEISPDAVEAAQQFRELNGEARSVEFQTVINEFLQTHRQEPGTVKRLPKPIVKKKVSKEQIIRLLGEPYYSNLETGATTYNLGGNVSGDTYVHSRVTLTFDEGHLIDAQILTDWGTLK